MTGERVAALGRTLCEDCGHFLSEHATPFLGDGCLEGWDTDGQVFGVTTITNGCMCMRPGTNTKG